MAASFDTVFRKAIEPFYDSESIASMNPNEDFSVFFTAFQAKKKMTIEEIDNEFEESYQRLLHLTPALLRKFPDTQSIYDYPSK